MVANTWVPGHQLEIVVTHVWHFPVFEFVLFSFSSASRICVCTLANVLRIGDCTNSAVGFEGVVRVYDAASNAAGVDGK